MNNQQFRRLLIDNSGKTPSASLSSSNENGAGVARQGPGATPALGSRARSSIPMTPRNVGGSASELFARQLREQQDANKGGAQKKVRSSAAPKGYKLAAGYTDRAQLRNADTPEDDKEARIKALEETVKLGQMEETDFQKVRDQIVGGDIKNVHLVKGLDYRLLARARAGEDVYSTPPTADDGPEEKPAEDVDELLDNLESAEVKPVQREERVKQGTMAAPPVPAAGKKRTRDDILREMKEARARAAAEQQAAAQPALGAHFKRIGPKNEPGTSRIEIDDQGREILIVVDRQGNVKRKIKKQKGDARGTTAAMPMPDKDAKPLGMEVPENLKAQLPEVEESEDIFADAGSDYNPLGKVDDDDSNSDSSDGEGEAKAVVSEKQFNDRDKTADEEKPVEEKAPNASRNYFGTEMDTSTTTDKDLNPMNDPSILNALKRASASKAAEDASEQSGDADLDKARLARMRARLAEQDRDAEDMDMGFGSSRFEDAEDGEERPVKLAKWTGKANVEDDDEDDEHTGRGRQQRKRGKKKKKGDKNDASTVLSVIEGRKG